ncbi:AAA family ATPase [Streptomyces sp. NPDC032940]|uniref:AAA family ATPase n=1 Tax=Streptomyces sp. NPDC032940 TaxID=3155366 RepID=UPI0033D116DF
MREATGGERGTVLDIVVDEYDAPTFERLSLLRRQVHAVVDLLVAGGFHRHPAGGRRRDDLRHRPLRDLFFDLKLPPDTQRLLVYWAGHGRQLQNSGLYLLCSDSGRDAGSVTSGDTITPAYLGEHLALSGARDIVLVMDACSSGSGAGQAADAFSRVVDERHIVPRPKLVVVSSAVSGEPAGERALTEALRALLEDPEDQVEKRGWGPRDQGIRIDEMINALEARLGSRQPFEIRTTGVFSTPFFPNPRYDPELPATELERRRTRPALLRADVREHFMLKFRGIDAVDGTGFFFRGRTRALQSLVTWLRTAAGGMFVVTGPPGSGKSALLGRLAVLSDASYRQEIRAADPHAVDGADPGTLPDVGAIDVGVHARDKDVLDCVDALARTLSLEAPRGGWRTPEQLVTAVGRRHGRLTVLVDALDEARPHAVGTIAGRLLRPLADLPEVKVLVGTRRRAVEVRDSASRDLLKVLAPEPGCLLDLHQDSDAVDDVEAYAYKRLTDLEGSPYALADSGLTRQTARRVARESESVFLLARLFTRALAGRSDILDPDGPEAREIFRSRDVAEVFAADLARYGGTLRQKVTDLLAPLAWALGPGLPRRAVWATAATALTRGARAYTEADVAWVMTHAGAHLIEAGEEGESVYRLYHQAYADYLRGTVGEADHVPALVYEAVLDTVPRVDGRRDWEHATRYVLKHLPAYALAAGRLGHLLGKTGILPYADPARMMRVLNSPEQQGRSLPRLYLRVWDELRNLSPEDRAAVLCLRAGVDEPDALPRLGTEALLGWRVRWGTGRRTNFHGVLVGGPTGAVTAVAIDLAPYGALTVAAGDDRGTVRLWDGASGELVHTLLTGEAPVTAVGLVRSRGRLLLAAAAGRAVCLWDVHDGARSGNPCRHRRTVRAMALSATEQGEPLLVTSTRGGRLRLWDTDRGEPSQVWHGGGLGTPALSLTALPGIGDVLVAAHTTGGISTWKLAPSPGAREPRLWWRVWPGQLRARHGIAVAAVDGRAVVVARGGTFVDGMRCLDLRTGKPVDEEQTDGPKEPADDGFTTLAVGVTPECVGGVKDDPAAFVVGGPEGKVRLRSGRGPVGGWTGHSGDVRAVAGVRSPDGDTFVVSGSQDGTVRLWNTAVSTTDDNAQHDESHEEVVTCADLVALPDGRLRLATGSADGTVWIWDGRTGRRIARCAVDAEVEFVPSMSEDGTGNWGNLVRYVRSGHDEKVSAISWVPAGDEHTAVLVSGSVEKSVQFWNADGTPLVRYEGKGPVTALTAAAPDKGDGGLVVVGHPRGVARYDGRGRELPARLGSRPRLLRSHRRQVAAVALVPRPDGQTWLASGDRGGGITLWDSTSRRIGRLRGPGDGGKAHRGPVRSLVPVTAPGAEGCSLLVSACPDVVRLWDPASRSVLAELGHGPVGAVAAAAAGDGRILVAVASGDRTVEIWDARAETRIAAVRGLSPRISALSMVCDRHASGRVWLAVGHGRTVHVVELLEPSGHRVREETR